MDEGVGNKEVSVETELERLPLNRLACMRAGGKLGAGLKEEGEGVEVGQEARPEGEDIDGNR